MPYFHVISSNRFHLDNPRCRNTTGGNVNAINRQLRLQQSRTVNGSRKVEERKRFWRTWKSRNHDETLVEEALGKPYTFTDHERFDFVRRMLRRILDLKNFFNRLFYIWNFRDLLKFFLLFFFHYEAYYSNKYMYNFYLFWSLIISGNKNIEFLIKIISFLFIPLFNVIQFIYRFVY